MNKNLIISRIKQTIRSNDPGADAFLFGSRARGDYRPDSDWDILILVDSQKVTNEIEDKFRDGLYDIELEAGQIISTFIYSKAYWKNNLKYSPIYNDIENEGIPL
ncbi:MAG: nucleotidyltransferase domain-containing protein [Bacteroidales bacterium]